MKTMVRIAAFFTLLSWLPALLWAQSVIYVTYDQAMMFASQSTQSDVLFEIPKGAKLELTAESAEWAQVNYNEKTGYIQSSQIAFPAPDWQQLRTKYTTNKKVMTRFQYRTWKEQTQNNIVGHRFYFEGTVNNVEETWTGRLIAKLSVAKGSVEVEFNPKKDKDAALRFEKSKVALFAGEVKSVVFDVFSGDVRLRVNYQNVLP